MRLILIPLLICFPSVLPANDSLPWQIEREWKTSDGKYSAVARFVGQIDGSVVLKRKDNGKLVDIPVDKLAKDDVDFIAENYDRPLETEYSPWQRRATPAQSVKLASAPRDATIATAPKTATEKIVAQCESLIKELQGFKSKADFHKMGFGRGGPYYAWMKKVENLRDSVSNSDDDTLSMDALVLAGDILILGKEYLKSKGQETVYSRYFFNEILPIAKGQEPKPNVAVKPQLPESENVDYKIISDTSLGRIKRSVDVQLAKKLTERNIEKIAFAIRSIKRENYERTFILYYLPGMEVGAGAWATSHFDEGGEVEVRFTGIEP